jgi:hypothetical protein
MRMRDYYRAVIGDAFDWSDRRKKGQVPPEAGEVANEREAFV